MNNNHDSGSIHEVRTERKQAREPIEWSSTSQASGGANERYSKRTLIARRPGRAKFRHREVENAELTNRQRRRDLPAAYLVVRNVAPSRPPLERTEADLRIIAGDRPCRSRKKVMQDNVRWPPRTTRRAARALPKTGASSELTPN
jgi:hypothetical protein